MANNQCHIVENETAKKILTKEFLGEQNLFSKIVVAFNIRINFSVVVTVV